MFKRVITILFLLGFVAGLMAQSTGKISGIVRDKDSGEALPGVNVVIKESLLGASTDVDGTFIILNVPPGTHTVSFSYVGYQSTDIEGVRVVTDLTKRLEVELGTTTLDLGTSVTVTVDKPFFEQAATNTVRVLDSEEIERIPVKGVNSIVSINAGVVSADGSGGQTDNATLNVRGGRGNETLFIVDGIVYNDALFGNAAGTIPDAAVEQVSSQLGGFSAKYGSAQSAVVNITTKSGSSKYFGGIEGVSSGFGGDNTRFDNVAATANLTPEQRTAFEAQLDKGSFSDDYVGLDAFGYKQLTGYLGGPLIPGKKNLTFFLSGEYINALDDNPRASGLSIPTAGIDQDWLPDNEGRVMRFTGKIDSYIGTAFKITASGNASFRDGRDYIHSYAKNNSFHNLNVYEDVIGTSLKLTHTINNTTFYDVTFRAKSLKNKRYDGFWDDDLFAYGNAARNAEVGAILPGGDGNRIARTAQEPVFYPFGRVSNNHRKYDVRTYGGDLNFTKQLSTHFIEFGGSIEQNTVRYYSIAPVALANGANNEESFVLAASSGSFYGYDIFGNEVNTTQFRTVDAGTINEDRIEEAAAPKPLTVSFYMQDRIEFQDFILNLGLRFDSFDPDGKRFANRDNALGTDGLLSTDDFEDMPVENYISPRLGFAFPVSPTTVFHAQYGIFRQQPRFFDLYDSWVNLSDLEAGFDGQGQNDGHLQSEETVQYEFGFKKQFGQTASLDLTAYYKNVKGLTNVITRDTRYAAAADFNQKYITAANTDFGTVKGLALSLNLRAIGPISAKVDYTLALNEGTGSSQSSSQTATFRNDANEVPKSIAPLDFDQRHSLTANVDIRAGKDEGPKMGSFSPLSNAGANFLLTFNSGRPYTPKVAIDLLGGGSLTNSQTVNTINSAYAEGVFRIDMRLDKRINIGSMTLVPYVFVQNLLDRANFNSVYESTGAPDDTGWLRTATGQQQIATSAQANNDGGELFRSDYAAFEQDPENYGIPRIIRAGLQLKF
ncbi:MAG: TonB-dependent receptor [Calditrichia bacterium]